MRAATRKKAADRAHLCAVSRVHRGDGDQSLARSTVLAPHKINARLPVVRARAHGRAGGRSDSRALDLRALAAQDLFFFLFFFSSRAPFQSDDHSTLSTTIYLIDKIH